MKNSQLLILSVYLASVATSGFADSSTRENVSTAKIEGTDSHSESEKSSDNKVSAPSPQSEGKSSNSSKSETSTSSSKTETASSGSKSETSSSHSESEDKGSSSSKSETSTSSPKTETASSGSKSETSSSNHSESEGKSSSSSKSETATPVVNNAPKVETPVANPVVKTETTAPKSETAAPVVNNAPKVETPAANPVVKTETTAPTSETVAPVVSNAPKVETPAANPVVKTETPAPTSETVAPVVSNAPKVETPAANPVVKTETTAPKSETAAPVVNNTPKVETPAANPIAVSAPNISLSAPAPNPVYIAPKDDKATVDTKSVQEVKAVEDSKQNSPVVATTFIAKNDFAKTCPNTPAIIDIGSNDDITGTGSYRTTFSTSNGSTVTNNWDGWNGKDGTVTYVPGKDFRGLDTFTYTIRDQDGKTSVATVSVEVSCDEAGFGSVSSCSAYAISDDYSLMPVVVHRTQLLKIDQSSGQVTTVGEPLPPKEGIEGLAISPITHTMYAISGGYAAKNLNGSLYRMNSNTGEIQLVGETGFKGTSSLAFRNDGSLWAWSNSGLISIDPNTAQASLVFSSNKDFEGLAWSSDGKTLYASKFTSLWAYDGSDVKRICNNFPDEVESLETLSNGLLMYSLSQQRVDAASNALYVYDPKQCKLISSIPVGGYRDIESVAWAYDCQNHTPSTSGFVKFEGDAETQMCLEPSQWLEVKGSVSLQPATASAQLQTIWQVIEPPQAGCPQGECQQAQVKTQVVTGDTPFYIKGWWDGLKKQGSVKLRYTAKLLDMQGQPLADSTEVSKTLVATAEACGKTGSAIPAGAVGQAAIDSNALQSYFKEMGLKQFSIDDHGKLSVTFDGKTHHGMFSYVIGQGSVNAEQKLSLKAIPDANADGVDDFVVIYPNGQIQLLLYLGNQ